MDAAKPGFCVKSHIATWHCRYGYGLTWAGGRWEAKASRLWQRQYSPDGRGSWHKQESRTQAISNPLKSLNRTPACARAWETLCKPGHQSPRPQAFPACVYVRSGINLRAVERFALQRLLVRRVSVFFHQKRSVFAHVVI